MKNFAMKHIYLFNLLVIFISMMILGPCSQIFSSGSFSDILLMNLLGRLLPSALLLLILVRLGLKDSLRMPEHNLFRGLLLCIPLFLVLILFQIINLPKNTELDLTPGILDLSGCVFYMLCAGIFEEVLVRGVVFKSMELKWHNQSNATMKAALISSTLFGSLHLFNLLESPDLIFATISQFIYAILFGIFFCGIYVKTKNLWTVVLTHAIVDLIASLPAYFSSAIAAASEQDTSLFISILCCIIIAPFALIGIKYIRTATNNTKPIGANAYESADC